MYDISTLTKHRLDSLRKKVLLELKARYYKSRGTKYGQLNKGFTEEELQWFLRQVTSKRAKLIFLLMANLGLRIHEACSLRTEDVDLVTRRVWVRSQKESYPTMLFLHDGILAALQEHLNDHEGEWVFPAKQAGKFPYCSPDWARNQFSIARAAAGLDFTYSKSRPGGVHGSIERRLHRLTTHSLRHYFIRKVHQGDLRLTQRLARHKDVRNTTGYIYVSQEEMDRALIRVFR